MSDKKQIDDDEKKIDDDEKKIDDSTEEKKEVSKGKKAAAVVAIVAVTVATGGVALVAAASAAKNPDSKLTKVAESIPVVGYAASATHAAKGDADRSKRAAAKCTGSTVKATVAVGTTIAIAATGGTAAAPVVAAAAAAGAAGGGASVFAESQIAKGIKDESIKKECNQGTAKDYAKGIAGGAVKGALAGGAMEVISGLDAVADGVDTVGDVVGDVGDVVGDVVDDDMIKVGKQALKVGKQAMDVKEEIDDVIDDVITDDVKALAKAGYEDHKDKKLMKKDDEKKDDMDYWEYDPQQMDNIYICTGQGMKYICCDKKGRIQCDKKGKKGTIFESIPHKKDESKVALKSNEYYLFIDESKKNKVTTSKEIYYFKVVSQSNSKYSFISQNGYYLYFTKGGKKIACKLKKDIKLAEIKFFVSNASQ